MNWFDDDPPLIKASKEFRRLLRAVGDEVFTTLIAPLLAWMLKAIDKLIEWIDRIREDIR